MPAPYYADDLVTLYHGDCREITEWLAADVLVTDPPYGRAWSQRAGLSNGDGQGRGSKPHAGIANDKDTATRDAALALWCGGRPILGGRPAIVFGDPLIPPPYGTRQALVYAKPMDAGIKGAHAGFRRDVEMIYLVGSWAAGLGGGSSILKTGAFVAGPRGLSVRYEHPHAKPVDVMCDLLGASCKSATPSGAIADPFAGSGSTLVAAAQMGLCAIGVELDERYCEIAAKRLSQGTLFGGAA